MVAVDGDGFMTVEKASAVEDTSVVEDASAVEGTPMVEDTLMADDISVVEEASATKDTPPERMDDFFDSRIEIYDKHMLADMGLAWFYKEVAILIQPSRPDFSLLDLGCGTGLELESLFETCPQMQVTGIDLSSNMLARLQAKFSDRTLRLIQGSFFDTDFGGEFDFVLSTYALHHFNEHEKLVLYQKTHAALKPGGTFLFGDYTVPSQELQQEFFESSITLRARHGIGNDEICHIDTPFTTDCETSLMKRAGFTSVRVVRQWENGSIIIAKKATEKE